MFLEMLTIINLIQIKLEEWNYSFKQINIMKKAAPESFICKQNEEEENS